MDTNSTQSHEARAALEQAGQLQLATDRDRRVHGVATAAFGILMGIYVAAYRIVDGSGWGEGLLLGFSLRFSCKCCVCLLLVPHRAPGELHDLYVFVLVVFEIKFLPTVSSSSTVTSFVFPLVVVRVVVVTVLPSTTLVDVSTVVTVSVRPFRAV